MLSAEGTIYADFYQAQLHPALVIQIIDGFADGLATAAHGNDYICGFRIAAVVEEIVVATNLCAHFFHAFLDDPGGFVIVKIAGFAALEIYVRTLLAYFYTRCVRSEGAFTEVFHQFVIQHLLHGVIIHHVDLLQFVRGAETVKEKQEGN